MMHMIFIILFYFVQNIRKVTGYYEISRSIPTKEWNALSDLYRHTNGENWKWRNETEFGPKWNFSTSDVNPCNISNIHWQGLTCNYNYSIKYDHIISLNLLDYNLSGSIPQSIYDLSYLFVLDLSNNSITNDIPKSIENLNNLMNISLQINQLTGSIPSLLLNITNLQHFTVFHNSITGTFPAFLSTSLQEISVANNLLTSTLPEALCNLDYLQYLSLSNNSFDGTISPCLGNLKDLYYLDIGINSFTSTIPSTITNLINIEWLGLNDNQFTGIFPNSCNYTKLKDFLIYHNMFSGTLPRCLENSNQLINFGIDENHFTGKLYDYFSYMPSLLTIQLYNNFFYGTIPTSIRNLKYLQYLFLQQNSFSGKLVNVFNSSHQYNMKSIQLSNNQFTGKLPYQVFEFQNLEAFSAVENCFDIDLPATICNATRLKALALDGLRSASSCRNELVSGFLHAYVVKRHESKQGDRQKVLECIFKFKHLEVFHISGNGLTGSFPTIIKNFSSSLMDLSLSYNSFSGTIPDIIQYKKWNRLDLSHNRFTGTLRTNFHKSPKNSTIYLNNNRLSGLTPSSLHDAAMNLSILSANLYTCNYDRSDLPHHDDHRDIYECGSNTFDIVYYILIGFIFTISSFLILAWYYRYHINQYINLSITVKNISNWINVPDLLNAYFEKEPINKSPLLYFQAYYTIQEIILRSTLYIVIFIMVILLPVYLVISSYFATHTYEYAWTVSILYLTGQVALGIIMTILILFIILQVYIFYYSFEHSKYKHTLQKITKHQDKIDLNDSEIKLWKLYWIYFNYISINFIIVGGVNVAYVYVVLNQYKKILILCQILLSIFKMVWNNIISPKMIFYSINYLSVMNSTNKLIQRRLFILQFVVSLFNNIVIPCFVVGVISRNCFYYVFEQQSDVTSSFSYTECMDFDTSTRKCLADTTSKSKTSYSPPFIYSYQCSSDLVIYYASVFILMCFISTFVVPLLNLCYYRLLLRYPWIKDKLKLNNDLDLNDTITTSDLKLSVITISQIYEYLVFIFTMVGLLLTFGVVFPPLAIAFLITIYRRIYYHQAVIGRFISHKMEHNIYSYLEIIEEDCKVIPLLSTIEICAWVLLYISCIFYTFFLFDILGDDVGVAKAYWVFIVMPCIPTCVYIVYQLYLYHLSYLQENIISKPNNDSDCDNSSTSVVELSEVSIISNPLFIPFTNISINNEEKNVIVHDIYVEDREGKSIAIQHNIL